MSFIITLNRYLLAMFSLAFFISGQAAEPIGNANPINQKSLLSKDFKRYTAFGDFDGIKAFLISAIEDRGIKINNISHISNMLQRTGADVGDTKVIYSHAEAIEFCSAALSRQMMRANPHNIVFCPYIVFIYELADDTGTIFLAYRRPFYRLGDENDASLSKVDELLSNIIEEVVE